MKRISLDTTSFRTTHWNTRPEGSVVDTLIVHTMFNYYYKEPLSIAGAFKTLEALSLSTHYYIGRNGEIAQSVLPDNRAWHAGDGTFILNGKERTQFNDTSIGVECIASFTSGITEAQYEALTQLRSALQTRFPLQYILGHRDIAPERKEDPWCVDVTIFKRN